MEFLSKTAGPRKPARRGPRAETPALVAIEQARRRRNERVQSPLARHQWARRRQAAQHPVRPGRGLHILQLLPKPRSPPSARSTNHLSRFTSPCALRSKGRGPSRLARVTGPAACSASRCRSSDWGRLLSRRGCSRSACVANGRLGHAGEGAVRHAPPCVVSRV